MGAVCLGAGISGSAVLSSRLAGCSLDWCLRRSLRPNPRRLLPLAQRLVAAPTSSKQRHTPDGTTICGSLSGDTARDHGGKGALVLPKAFEDGFPVLRWGRLALLARVSPSTARDVVPRMGPPLPADASLDDAVRLHREGAAWEAEQL